MLKLVGFTGLKGAGKDTACNILEFNGFEKRHFIAALKDCVASIYGWDRKMLDGETPEDREWRETEDKWWANKLNRPGFCPRIAMEEFGDITRTNIDINIWVYSLDRYVDQAEKSIVFSGVRFSQEIDFIHYHGGKVFEVQRGELPIWYNDALEANKTGDYSKVKHIPITERAWIGYPNDGIIYNNGSLTELHDKVARLCDVF
jgi:hypothetical protein